jgi:TRAP transporter TAXI family solute receptor
MKFKKKSVLTLFFVSLALLAFSTASVQAQSATEMPRVMNIIGHGVGSKLYGLAAGFAKVGSKNLSTEFKVVPTAGPAEWMPMAQEGEVDLAVVISFDGMEGHYGVGFFKGQPSNGMMVLFRGGNMRIGPVARNDSGVKTLKDVKGKRYVLFSAGRAFTLQSKGFLANAGLTVDDVKVLTVPGPKDGTKALIEGRADVTGTAEVTMGVLAELEAGRGAHYLSLDPSPEGVAAVKKFFPVGKPLLVKPGPGIRAVKEPSWLWTFDWYLSGSKNLKVDVVYEIVKTYWNHDKELWPIHGGLKQTKKEIFMTDDPSFPYHPGAIKFYKEMGVWTKEMDAKQAELLKKGK